MAGGGQTQARAHRADYSLVLITFALLTFGLVVMYSISPIQSQKLLGSTVSNFYFFRHLEYALVGLVGWFVASRIHYTRWRSWASGLMVIAVVALLVLLIPGLSLSQLGATRWLKLGPLSFQPAELMKLALIIYLGRWLTDERRSITSVTETIVPFALILGFVTVVVVVLQRDMGTMSVLAGSAIGMLYVAGVRPVHLAGLIAGFGLAAWGFIAAFPHRVERILAYLNPNSDTSSVSYHISQALIAVGSGGLFGVGLGKSIQVYGYLPEAPNDSIFAIIGEEFGLIGALILIGLMGYLIYRALMVAKNAPDNFGRLVATGIALWLMFQTVVNVGAMVALIPLTGIPLPFISFGGSSLIMTLFAMGILVNISKYTVGEESHASRRERRGDGRSYFAHSGRRQPAENA